MLLTASSPITLRGGLSVSLDALRLLWDFEHRGCVVRRGDDGMLEVGPGRLLSDVDREHIRQHRDELLALVTYCETVQ